MRILLDTAILVRGHSSSKGLARDLLISIVESDHILLLSNEMLFELANLYPRMNIRQSRGSFPCHPRKHLHPVMESAMLSGINARVEPVSRISVGSTFQAFGRPPCKDATVAETRCPSVLRSRA
jgi:predicted nucleic acid-binding protein